MSVHQHLPSPNQIAGVPSCLAEHTQQPRAPLPHQPAGPVRADGGQAGRALCDRGLMGEDPQGRIPGSQRPIHHDLRVAGRQRRAIVVGDLRQPTGPAGQRLQRDRDLQVQRPPHLGADVCPGGLPQQRVHEPTGRMLGKPAPQDPRGDRLAERVSKAARRQPCHGGKDPLADLVAGHRRHCHHLAGVATKPGQPLAHHLTDRRAHRQLVRQPGALARGRPAHKLVDEERVAPACPVQPPHLLGSRLGPGQRRGLRRDRRLVQRTDRDQGALTVELPEQPHGGRLACRPDRPLSRQHQQPAVGQAAAYQGGQRQRCRVGIVDVVQDDQQRPVGGGRAQDVDDRALQRQPGAVRVQAGCRRHLTRLGKLRHQIDQPGRSRRVDPARQVGCASQGAENLLPEPVRRRRSGVPGAPPRHHPSLPGGQRRRMLGQCRLANAWLPDQVHHPRRTPPRRRHRRRDRRQLPCSTHQHTGRLGRRHTRNAARRLRDHAVAVDRQLPARRHVNLARWPVQATREPPLWAPQRTRCRQSRCAGWDAASWP